MELRICGTEQKLAEFLKALGTAKVIANAVVDKPKAVPKTKTKFVDTKYLANKYNITGQAIRNYVKKGMPHKMVDNSYQYNEEESSAWIDNYISTHESKTRGKKYTSANTKKQIKTGTEYAEWKSALIKTCRDMGKDEGKMLSLTFKRMTKVYGIVWDQVKKDYKAINGYYPRSTTQMAYWLETSKPVYKNIVSSCLDTVLKEVS